MAYEDDMYRDEDGAPLMDYDDIQSDGDDQPPQPLPPSDDLQDFTDFDADSFGGRENSPAPESSSKPRKRLLKKRDEAEDDAVEGYVPAELNDFAEEDGWARYEDEEVEERVVSKKRKDKGMSSSGGKKEKKSRRERFDDGGGKAKLSLRRRNGGEEVDAEADPEVNEMWATIAGADSEDDQEGMKTVDDDNFIDDEGVDPSDRYVDGGSPSRFAQAEEGEEAEDDFFKPGKKKKKNERSAEEIGLMVEELMADFECACEEDAQLNTEGKPAINKLKKLSLLVNTLSKKQLQHEFLDHGVLSVLKNWLEPLPDGSLPNINIREAILRILNDLPIDLDQYDRREQLKKSGLGKVVMFLSRSDEETTSNRKLAKELVDKWSRPIFNKSTRFEDMRNVEEDRIYRRPSVKKPASKASGLESQDDDLEFSSGRKAGPSGARMHASRPEATPMDFVIRPQSKVDPDEVRARGKQAQQDERRMKMNKKMQQLKANKRKKLQATKVSVEGRGMVKYL